MKEAVNQLLAEGADLAMPISASLVVTAAWPVMKCRYGCPNYGHNRCCPPYSPAWEEMRAILGNYTTAILFRTHSITAGTPLAVSVAAGLFRRGYYKVLPFGTGSCRLCAECTPDSCPRPWETAPSMEACGVDVFATVRNAGVEVSSYAPEGSVPDCFGLILVE
jgi:predicted metal-binding protein